MLKVNTHLHLALKLAAKTSIEDLESFLLGSAYSHHRDTSSADGSDDFSLGHFFRLWVDDHYLDVDTGDISKYDRMICDMPVILPVIQQLKQKTFTDKKYHAMQNILSLEAEPMPLYLVPKEKKARYEVMLNILTDKFIEEHLVRK